MGLITSFLARHLQHLFARMPTQRQGLRICSVQRSVDRRLIKEDRSSIFKYTGYSWNLLLNDMQCLVHMC